MTGHIIFFIVGMIVGAAVTFLLMYNPKAKKFGIPDAIPPIPKDEKETQAKTRKKVSKAKKANDALIKKIDRKGRKK